MRINTNTILQRLPYRAGDVLLDDSAGQYDPIATVKRLLECFREGQTEVTPDFVIEGERLVELGQQGWMEEYEYGDTEDHWYSAVAGLTNDLVEKILDPMLRSDLTLEWIDGALIVVEVD